MRDFDVTAEPSGRQPVATAKRLRFVIQKHDATRLHYDFRLELNGTFRSWAVTRGPSLNPADKRLAVEVEDHPLDYGDFEGTIPKGQYGGGTVMLWDRGYLGAGRRSRQDAGQGRPEIHPGRREAARRLGAGADARRQVRRQAQQLAADQASRPICEGRRWRSDPGEGSFGGVGPRHGGDRRSRHRRQAQAFHAGQGVQGRCGLAVEEPAGSTQRRRSRTCEAKADSSQADRPNSPSSLSPVHRTAHPPGGRSSPRFVEPQLAGWWSSRRPARLGA